MAGLPIDPANAYTPLLAPHSTLTVKGLKMPDAAFSLKFRVIMGAVLSILLIVPTGKD